MNSVLHGCMDDMAIVVIAKLQHSLVKYCRNNTPHCLRKVKFTLQFDHSCTISRLMYSIVCNHEIISSPQTCSILSFTIFSLSFKGPDYVGLRFASDGLAAPHTVCAQLPFIKAQV